MKFPLSALALVLATVAGAGAGGMIANHALNSAGAGSLAGPPSTAQQEAQTKPQVSDDAKKAETQAPSQGSGEAKGESQAAEKRSEPVAVQNHTSPSSLASGQAEQSASNKQDEPTKQETPQTDGGQGEVHTATAEAHTSPKDTGKKIEAIFGTKVVDGVRQPGGTALVEVYDDDKKN